MKKSFLVAIGSIISAVLASLCCIGPLMISLLGIGSVSAFAALESWRPLIIVITIVLLGVAFYFAYHERKVCQDGTCRVERSSRWNRIGIWGAAIIACSAMLLPVLQDGSRSSEPLTKSHSSGSLSHLANLALNIEGMECASCARGLEAVLSRVSGVQSVNVSFQSGTAILVFDPTMTTPQNLIASIEKEGYTVRTHDSVSIRKAQSP